MSTVLIVDDDAALCRLWKGILATAGHKVNTAGTCAEAGAVLSTPSASLDAVLVDLKLPDGNGASLLPAIAKLNPRPEVAVVSGYYSAAKAISFWPGAIAVPKPLHEPEILELVRKLTERSNSVQEFASEIGLSRQQTKLVQLCADRKSDDEILAQMGCGAGTVKSYWQRIFTKLGVHSQRDVLALYTRFLTRRWSAFGRRLA